MSAIFVHDEEQERLAIASREQASRGGREIFTEIAPLTEFYLAEDYHQKYSLRGASEIMAEFDAMYPSNEDFVHSTAAARVNGYLAGWGTPEALRAEVGEFGLSPAGERRLIARRGRR